jgi:hypothetical protein
MTVPIRDITAIPAREEVFANPPLFDGLPPHVQGALYEEVVTLEARWRARILSPQHTQQTASLKRVVGIDEASGLLGMTKDYLYRNWKTLGLGGYRDRDGHIKFPLGSIERYIERMARQ